MECETVRIHSPLSYVVSFIAKGKTQNGSPATSPHFAPTSRGLIRYSFTRCPTPATPCTRPFPSSVSLLSSSRIPGTSRHGTRGPVSSCILIGQVTHQQLPTLYRVKSSFATRSSEPSTCMPSGCSMYTSVRLAVEICADEVEGRWRLPWGPLPRARREHCRPRLARGAAPGVLGPVRAQSPCPYPGRPKF